MKSSYNSDERPMAVCEFAGFLAVESEYEVFFSEVQSTVRCRRQPREFVECNVGGRCCVFRKLPL